MDHSRGGEEAIAGTEGNAVGTSDEGPLTRDHHIELVASMGLLRVGAPGSVELDRETASLEDNDESLPLRSREPG
jgi:hypothetical protein